MPDPFQQEAERIVWRWANQFHYKLNVPDDKIEALNQEVIAVLRTQDRASRQAQKAEDETIYQHILRGHKR